MGAFSMVFLQDEAAAKAFADSLQAKAAAFGESLEGKTANEVIETLAQAALHYADDLAETAVGNDKIDLRFIFETGNGACGPQRLAVYTQDRKVLSITLSCIVNETDEIACFTNRIGAESFLVLTMSAKIIQDDIKAHVKIHLRIFQRTDMIICVTVGKDDIPRTGMLIG